MHKQDVIDFLGRVFRTEPAAKFHIGAVEVLMSDAAFFDNSIEIFLWI